MSRTQRNTRGYEVGYGKPPLHSRFQPGQSGNPAGRRRPPKTPEEILADALNKKIAVLDNGQPRKITKHAAMVTHLVNRAASGDLKAAEKVLRMIQSPPARKSEEKKRETSNAQAHLQALIELTQKAKEASAKDAAEQTRRELVDAEQSELTEMIEEEYALFDIDSYRMIE